MLFQHKNLKIKGSIVVGLFFIVISSVVLNSLNNNPTQGADTSTDSICASGMPFYIEITGANQGPIEGSVEQSGFEGWILGYQYSHSIYYPTDPQSGQVTGQRIHSPVKIVKEIDQSTPKLMKALVTSESLTVEMEFYQINKQGMDEHYFTVYLEHAKIISIREYELNYIPTTAAGYVQPFSEEVAFVYEKITWTWELEGIEYTDTWPGLGKT